MKNPNRHGLNFSRDALVIDQLFKPGTLGNGKPYGSLFGLKLTPRFLTPTGIRSVSTKQHLPHFEEEPWVAEFMAWEKITKLQSTYLGNEAHTITKTKRNGDEYEVDIPATGIWQYISDIDGCIRPSYMLHRTVTGRTASNDPNGQNFPKRGDLATEYRKIFVPHDGYVLMEVDLSQAELRIAAWMANEKNMLRLYRLGKDIHAATAAAIVGVSLEKFEKGQSDETLLSTCSNLWPGSETYLARLKPENRNTIKHGSVKAYMKDCRQRAKAAKQICVAMAKSRFPSKLASHTCSIRALGVLCVKQAFWGLLFTH